MARTKGTPKTGGRTKGTPNRATAQVRGLAQAHGEDAIKVLVDEMHNPEATAPARIAAAIALLDRGYGKPRQSMELQSEGPRHVTEYSEEELIARIEALDAEDKTEH